MSARTALWSVTASMALLLVALLGAPGGAQPESPLVVVGDHQMTVIRGAADGPTSVVERIFLSNEAEEAYDGELWLDLHPEITRLTHSFMQPDGTPLGLSGEVSSAPLPNETVGAHQRHRLDLASRDVAIEHDATVLLRLTYELPASVQDFTRGFTLDTPRLLAYVGQVPGLVPTSDETPLESVSRDWLFTLQAGADGPFAPGDRFAFTWEETEVPLSPLSVQVTSAGSDPILLTATASGGIPPYTYTWDLNGDGVCDDGEGATVSYRPSEPGTHSATVCAADSATPPGETQTTYETRVELGAAAGPNPWLLLIFGVLVGALLLFGLTRAGLFAGTGAATSARRDGPALGAEPKDVLETRQRVMVAALKELELARKKGEVSESVYTPLKAELKKDTVRVMRELERRRDETI